jgi:hypothetical protein
MEPDHAERQWYGVRCVFLLGTTDDVNAYEERITIWRTETDDAAVELAEADATEYGKTMNAEYTGLAQSFWLSGSPGSGNEVFSLIRESDLEPDEYLDTYFDTGRERQSYIEPS